MNSVSIRDYDFCILQKWSSVDGEEGSSKPGTVSALPGLELSVSHMGVKSHSWMNGICGKRYLNKQNCCAERQLFWSFLNYDLNAHCLGNPNNGPQMQLPSQQELSDQQPNPLAVQVILRVDGSAAKSSDWCTSCGFFGFVGIRVDRMVIGYTREIRAEISVPAPIITLAKGIFGPGSDETDTKEAAFVWTIIITLTELVSIVVDLSLFGVESRREQRSVAETTLDTSGIDLPGL
ncbi:hypothetical protein K457DRAFT_125370 [Linnemannia elongata AG-77]|uniref:Uncharacterized protein n=1 Tax=Linnemannia elongata AG-77 TaxID=1314771 RepID=A0A197JZ35_9FUNG|nr:hypothetical protein K457DRAFT_125370 [Linnemannia elongata AG-77]